MLEAIIRFEKLKEGEKYHIGQFHKKRGSKKLWLVRSTSGGYTNEPRHLKTGREFYRISMPLGCGGEIIKE